MSRSGKAFALAALVAMVWLLPGYAHARDLTFEDRVRAQEAIERVYYSHQIGATEPFEEAVPRSVLENKVRTYLKQSVALDKFWKTPITAEMLEAELARMARQSRMPERLRELFSALGDDPFVVQECLARASLAQRLSHNFFAFDPTIHPQARERAEEIRDQLLSGLLDPTSQHADRTETVLTLAAEESPDGANEMLQQAPKRGGSGVFERKLSHTEFERERARLSAERGEPGPLLDEREALVVTVVLKEEADSVTLAKYAIRKRTWEDWWAEVSADLSEDMVRAVSHWDVIVPSPRLGSITFADQAGATPVMASNQPSRTQPCVPEGSWDTDILGVPDARAFATAVWTGSLMVVWGGVDLWGDYARTYYDTGARYDPATDTWMKTSTFGAPSARSGHSAVWTGSRMVVWAGASDSGPTDTGGQYDPATDSWTPTSTVGAPLGRSVHTAVWTGSRMVVWGGWDGTVLNTGGQYDPAADTWTQTSTTDAPSGRKDHTSVWTGSRMVVWGGDDGDWFSGSVLNTGGRYDPATDTWMSTATAGAPSGRTVHSAVWTGSRMVVWGGGEPAIGLTDTGGQYDPTTDTWTHTSTVGAPTARMWHAAAWTGSLMVVWGGNEGGFFENTGGRYDPTTDTWTHTSTLGAPSARAWHTAVWAGSRLVVWGGISGCWYSGCWSLVTGGRYDPMTDTWTPTSPQETPSSRRWHSAVWTGNLMVVWGGASVLGGENTGGRYDPATDTWTATSTLGAPSARTRHTAVWTGSRMVVWGGDGYLDGGRYDPTTDTWTATSTVGAPSARSGHTAVWTGSRMVVWGGWSGTALNTGGQYDPATDTWTSTSTIEAPWGRDSHTAVWTGSRMVVWGGWDGKSCEVNTGGRYDPATDTWTPTSTLGSPLRRCLHTAVWTGSVMVIWGGEGETMFHESGGRYDPVRDTWSATSTVGAPLGRIGHAAVWTGSRMVVWGGLDEAHMRINSGGQYDPAADTWTATSILGAPSPRTSHTAVWTGSRMVVWGGYNGYVYLNTGGGYDIGCPSCGSATGVVSFAPGSGTSATSGQNALGPPDGQAVPLGLGGRLVLAMGPPIIDGPGADFVVHEMGVTDGGGAIDENYRVEASADGFTFVLVGECPGDDCQFDLSGTGLTRAAYVRITDLPPQEPGTTPPNLGADIDAVTVLNCQPSLACQVFAPSSGTVSTPISFQATVPGGTGVVTYDWNFGDGSPRSSLQNPQHAYSAIGDYAWTLSVNDPDGRRCSRAGTITVGHPSQYCISAVAVPAEAGTVTIDPPGQCHPPGTSVTLTAVPSQSFGTPNSTPRFLGWSGSASGPTNPLPLILWSDWLTNATFTPGTEVLSGQIGIIDSAAPQGRDLWLLNRCEINGGSIRQIFVSAFPQPQGIPINAEVDVCSGSYRFDNLNPGIYRLRVKIVYIDRIGTDNRTGLPLFGCAGGDIEKTTTLWLPRDGEPDLMIPHATPYAIKFDPPIVMVHGIYACYEKWYTPDGWDYSARDSGFISLTPNYRFIRTDQNTWAAMATQVASDVVTNLRGLVGRPSDGSFPPWIYVGHSQGGLVGRVLVNNQPSPSLVRALRSAFLVATPNSGSLGVPLVSETGVMIANVAYLHPSVMKGSFNPTFQSWRDKRVMAFSGDRPGTDLYPGLATPPWPRNDMFVPVTSVHRITETVCTWGGLICQDVVRSTIGGITYNYNHLQLGSSDSKDAILDAHILPRARGFTEFPVTQVFHAPSDTGLNGPGLRLVLEETLTIGGGLSADVRFTVSETDIFRIETQVISGSGMLSVLDPQGTGIDFSTLPPAAGARTSSLEGDTFTLFSPSTGFWTLHSTAAQGDLVLLVRVFESSPVGLEGFVVGSPVTVSETARVLARWTGDLAGLTGIAEVTAEVRNDVGAVVAVTQLFDDGDHQDEEPNDGLFGGALAPLLQGGRYTMTFRGTGSYQTHALQRQAITAFDAIAGFGWITGEFADGAFDTDFDGLYDTLSVTVGLNIADVAGYLLSADLSDIRGYKVASAATSFAATSAGPMEAAIHFDLFELRCEQLVGPLLVSNLRLADERDSQIKDAWPSGVLTRQYPQGVFKCDDAPAAPRVSAASPDAILPGSSGRVVVSGSGFDEGVTFGFGAGVTVSEIRYSGPDVVAANISVEAAAMAGARDITVTNPDGRSSIASNLFSVGIDQPPSISFLNLVPLQIIVGNPVIVLASAADDRGILRVDFFVDGSPIGSDSTFPYSFSWSTGGVSPGPHTVTATAYDTIQQAATTSVTITVGCPGPPAEVENSLAVAHFEGTTQISWDGGGGAFAVYRGRREVDRPWSYNQSCLVGPIWRHETPDADLPIAGSAFFYLVSRLDYCGESALGYDSLGSPIPNTNPCSQPDTGGRTLQ